MNLYLNDKERKIVLLDLMEKLLYAAYNDPNLQLKSVDELATILPTYDPVQEFVEYYLMTEDKVLDMQTKRYVVNALYAAKGTDNVFELLRDLLGLDIEADYDFPILSNIHIEDFETEDSTRFINNLTSLLFNLLYYGEASFALGSIILKLSKRLHSNYSIFVKLCQEITFSISDTSHVVVL